MRAGLRFRQVHPKQNGQPAGTSDRWQYLTYAVDPPELEIESDPQGMRQVLKELLGNAIKFTPAGGRIHLAVDQAGELAGEAPCSVRMVVSDTGIGMDAEQQAALFRPFVQGDQTLARRFEGLGLGLAFAYEMVTRLGGTITVDSAPGAGSSFTVLLPGQLSHN